HGHPAQRSRGIEMAKHLGIVAALAREERAQDALDAARVGMLDAPPDAARLLDPLLRLGEAALHESEAGVVHAQMPDPPEVGLAAGHLLRRDAPAAGAPPGAPEHTRAPPPRPRPPRAGHPSPRRRPGPPLPPP